MRWLKHQIQLGRTSLILAPRKADFDIVVDLMVETGVLDKRIEFEDYTDTRFSDRASIQTAWKYDVGTSTAK